MQKLGLRQQTGEHFRKLRERSSDQLLTALTVMLAVLLFVAAPMQAKGVIAAHYFGIAFVLVMVATVFIISGSMLAVVAITITIVLTVVSTVLRLRQPSIVDVYLEASGWIISGVTLSVVVARAVFAPGRVTYHRIIGAVLLYLCIGFIFIALYSFVALLVPNAFTGLGPLRDNLAGLLRLSTKPSLTGSPPLEKTIGIVAVAFIAVVDEGPSVATSTATC